MKLPFMQFYPADYLRDTRALSLSAKGAWIDILCVLHASETRGRVSFSPVQWGRIMGASANLVAEVFDELRGMGIADISNASNGDVTIECRRMLRESITKKQNALRVAKHRANAGSNAKVTAHKLRSLESQKLRNTEENTLPPASAAAGELFAKDAKVVEPKPAKKPKTRPRDPLMDALATVGGGKAAEVTQWAPVAVAMKQIKAVAPELTPAEIARRSENYRTHYPDCALTPTALAKHWALCDSAKGGTIRDDFGSVRTSGWGTEIHVDRSKPVDPDEGLPFNSP
jgi:hypothetical protein